MLLGTILLSMSGRYVGFRPVHLLYPFLSAFCFGAVAIIRKLGLQSCASHVWLCHQCHHGVHRLDRLPHGICQSVLRQANGKSLWYFVVAGMAENVGVLLVLIALSLGQVSVVTPLNGNGTAVRLALAFRLSQDIERLTGRIVLGTCSSCWESFC